MPVFCPREVKPQSVRSAKLRELKDLYDRGIVTKEEYEQKRAAILRGM